MGQHCSSWIAHSSTPTPLRFLSGPLPLKSSLPFSKMPPNPNQPPSHNSTVRQLRRLSVIRGPANPPLLNLTFGELTRRQSRKQANEVAVISQHQNEIITYSQLHKYSDDLAAGMIALSIKKGDRVAVLLGNRSEYVYVRRSHYSLLLSVKVKKN